MHLLLIFVAVISCIVLFISYLTNKQSTKYRKVPSPPGLPIIGHVLDMRNSVDVFQKLIKWTRELGKTFQLTVGPHTIYVTSDTTLIEKVTSSKTLIKKAKFYQSIQLMAGNGLIASYGNLWRNRRKAINPTFHFNILEKFMDTFDKHTKVLINIIETECNIKSSEISKLLSLYTLDIICDAAMGVHHDAQVTKDSPYVKAVAVIAQNMANRTYSIFGQNNFVYCLTPTHLKQRSSLKIIHNFAESVITKRRTALANTIIDLSTDEIGSKKHIAFLDFLLNARIEGKLLSNLEIREEVETMILAGHDTSGHALSFALYCLSKHPQTQKKIYEEITEMQLNNNEKTFSYSDLNNLKYTEMVLKEVLRLYSIIPYIGRELTEDLEHDGYFFKKGSTLLMNIYGVHTDPDNYEDPLIFNPERWSISNSKSAYAFIPFSAGPRNCIGQKFAMLEMKYALGKIVSKFMILPSDPDVKLILANEGVLVSKEGIHVAFKKRI